MPLAPPPRQQAAALYRAGDVPAARCVRCKAEKATIIFGIADHCHGFGGGGFDERGHQLFADAAALDVGADGDGADERERGGGDAHRPALQGADEQPVVECRKAEVRNSGHPCPNPVGRAGVAVGPECGIEEGFDGVEVGMRQGSDSDSHGGRANNGIFCDWKPACFPLGARR
jgi:hypothetical protein